MGCSSRQLSSAGGVVGLSHLQPIGQEHGDTLAFSWASEWELPCGTERFPRGAHTLPQLVSESSSRQAPAGATELFAGEIPTSGG